MKLLRKIVALCAFVTCAGWVSSTLAADATGTVAAALKKDGACTRCHDSEETKPILSIYQTKHGVKADSRTPTCQSCHGESKNHTKGDPEQKGRAAPDILFGTKRGTSGSYAPSEAKEQNAPCMTCHNTASGLRNHWAGSQHESSDVACVSCHSLHVKADPVMRKSTQPEVCFTCHKEQRAQSHRISTHPIAAGKMTCSDCHNPHGSTGPKMLVKNSLNETCYTCHAEKRGPFLWEHGPVTDDCANCHTPHGSSATPLLNTRVPFLCQECHSGDHASGINSASNLMGGNVLSVGGRNNTAVVQNSRAQLGARACLNCHVLVHGSNHPAGAKFQR